MCLRYKNTLNFKLLTDKILHEKKKISEIQVMAIKIIQNETGRKKRLKKNEQLIIEPHGTT